MAAPAAAAGRRGGPRRRADRPGLVPRPLTATADALVGGQLSAAHARVLAHGTRQLPDHVTADAEPKGAAVARQCRHERRGLWLAPTLDAMVAVKGLLDPEAGTTLLAALEPLARPADAEDDRSADQRDADALTELCRRSLARGSCPGPVGCGPQLLVTVDHASLLDSPGGVGGDLGWVGLLDRQACRRLACDGTVTRVVSSAQRSALAVRDRGCAFPGCDRPLAWCDAHHLWHWIDGGPTGLANLAMVCREHHRTVHEGGWQLTRGPDGRFMVTPGPPPHRPHRVTASHFT